MPIVRGEENGKKTRSSLVRLHPSVILLVTWQHCLFLCYLWEKSGSTQGVIQSKKFEREAQPRSGSLSRCTGGKETAKRGSDPRVCFRAKAKEAPSLASQIIPRLVCGVGGA